MKKRLILLILGIVVLLSACNSGETATQAVENVLGAIKKADRQSLSKYLDYDELVDMGGNQEDSIKEDKEQIKKIFENIEYKIVSSDEKDNEAIVKTEITNVDMSVAFKEFAGNAFSFAMAEAFKSDSEKISDEENNAKMNDMLFESIENNKDTKITNVVDIKLKKVDGQWKLEDIDENLQNALTGNLIKTTQELENSFNDLSEGVAEDSNSELPEDVLFDISNFVIGNIWNDGFWIIRDYSKTGKDGMGNTVDIDFTIEQLDKAMNKKIEYDEYISGLEGSKYTEIKEIWSKLSPETDELYNYVKQNKPDPSNTNYEFDTGIFVQYMDAFSDAVYNLE